MPELRFSIDIKRPPEPIFNLIADLANYSHWLPPSGTYAETKDISDSPVKAGTTYVDKNRLNTMYGKVTQFTPYSVIVFHQATKNPGMAITTRYELSPSVGGTHLIRTTTIELRGVYRLLQPMIVPPTRKENERTLQALKTYLEADNSR